jgi:single-strand DNA-binding protein
MAGINKVLIVGRVGQDPETRSFNSGDEMAEFSVATSESWRDKNSGERKEKTQWHRVKVLNDRLVKNVIRQYVNKGSLIGVEGQLETEEWTDKQSGEKRYATKVVVSAYRGDVYLLGSREDNGAGRQESGRRQDSNSGQRNSGQSSGQSSNYSRDLDDEIPF